MTSQEIYLKETKESTLEHACHSHLPPSFLLSQALDKGFVYSLEDVDSYIEHEDKWEERQRILYKLVDVLAVDNPTKRIIRKNGLKNS